MSLALLTVSCSTAAPLRPQCYQVSLIYAHAKCWRAVPVRTWPVLVISRQKPLLMRQAR